MAALSPQSQLQKDGFKKSDDSLCSQKVFYQSYVSMEAYELEFNDPSIYFDLKLRG